jgi:CRP-like cAMP-binding protein
MNKEPNRKFEWNSLKQQSLLQGLSDEQLRYLYEHSQEEKFLPNELIIEEGEHTTDVYLILEGEINILKWDEEHTSEVLIGHLRKGEAFGEMSFMDNSPRSTTIKASKPVILLKLTKEVLSSIKDILSQIYANIALLNINRLRVSNRIYVRNLVQNQRLFQIRQNIGQFLIYQYLIFCLAVVLVEFLVPKDFQIYLPWLITLIPAIAMIKSYSFEISHFGLNVRHWPSVIFLSFFAVALTIGLLYLLNRFLYFYAIPYSMLEWPLTKNILSLSLWPFYALYCFSQEFIARGVLQTSLQEFLHDDKGYKALFITSIFLLFLFLPLDVHQAINLFLIGLPMGLLYLKQRSILGIFLIHFLLICLGVLKI